MPWPKGKPRVGYIKKDGTAHAKKGERITMVRPAPETYKQVKSDKDDSRVEKEVHGASTRPVIEVCPNCAYAYADGGYCSECGWHQVMPGCPHCKKAAR